MQSESSLSYMFFGIKSVVQRAVPSSLNATGGSNLMFQWMKNHLLDTHKGTLVCTFGTKPIRCFLFETASVNRGLMVDNMLGFPCQGSTLICPSNSSSGFARSSLGWSTIVPDSALFSAKASAMMPASEADSAIA